MSDDEVKVEIGVGNTSLSDWGKNRKAPTVVEEVDIYPSIEEDDIVDIRKFRYFRDTDDGKLTASFVPKNCAGIPFVVYRKMYIPKESQDEITELYRKADYEGKSYDMKLYKSILFPYLNQLKNRAKTEIVKRMNDPLCEKVRLIKEKFVIPDGYVKYRYTKPEHRFILDFGIRLMKTPSDAADNNKNMSNKRTSNNNHKTVDNVTNTTLSSHLSDTNDSLYFDEDEILIPVDENKLPIYTYFYCLCSDVCRKKNVVIKTKRFIPQFKGQINHSPECMNIIDHLKEKHWNILLQAGYDNV